MDTKFSSAGCQSSWARKISREHSVQKRKLSSSSTSRSVVAKVDEIRTPGHQGRGALGAPEDEKSLKSIGLLFKSRGINWLVT